MDVEQRYLFDTLGYLVVKQAITPALVEELRETFRQPIEQFEAIAGEDHPLHWSRAWRDLLDQPAITPIVESLAGNHLLRKARQARDGDDYLPTFRLDHINVHDHVTRGFAGMALHGGWTHTGGSQFFRYHDGEFYNGLIVVAFELYDTHSNGGGFCCVPGSHKSNVALPDDWRTPDHDPHEIVRKIPASAGDAIIFTEALTHGTAPWRVADRRRTAFYKFSPHGTGWSAAYLDPDDFADYPDMDKRKLAMLEPPNARYPGRPLRPVTGQ